ncbi:MAG: type III-B CRISPR module RAMP protein Cmr1 [Pyrinomonadaceae bacterium]
MRTPKINAPEEFIYDNTKRRNKVIIRETREYELITPLFGGGAITKQADEVSVVRTTEIRGHLRFWWRATRGGQFATIQELREHEDAIFGSTEKNSALQIDLTVTNRGETFPDQQGQPIDSIRSPLGYVAFPLRGENAEVIENIEFSVQFSYPSNFAEDLKASIWAWETFGGLGARTRRGFGAIQRKDYLPLNRNAVETDIQNGLTTHLNGNTWADDVPHLTAFASNTYKITNARNSMVDAWKHIIDSYQRFRQFRRPTRFSRSNWSEPDAIRRLFPTRSHPTHSTPKTIVDKFPRANFGLPIIFKFKDDDVRDGDPTTTTLEGCNEKQKRLASPLIFRVLKCADEKYVGIAIILSGIRVPTGGVILKDAPVNPIIQTDLTSTEASSAYLDDILNGNTNVLEAFLAIL